MEANVKRIKRFRLIRRLGTIGLAVSGFALSVVLILSFLPRDNNSFTIQIDKVPETAHFSMSSQESGGDSVTYLNGQPISNAYVTEAKDIERYIEGLDELKGAQNYVRIDDGYELAMVYTVYLSNTSEEEVQNLKLDVVLDGYSDPSNGSAPILDYFRVATRTKVVDSNDLPEYKFYGRERTKYLEIPNENNDNREAISSRNHTLDGSGNKVYIHDYESNGNDGYCINFEPVESGYLVKGADLSIPSGETLCFTFIGYFEGKDFDSDTRPPKGASLLISVHFGVE